MNQVESGQPLAHSDIKQLKHISDLLVARARSPKEIAAANNYQTNTIKAIVGNQLFNAPKVQDKVQYRGYSVELPHASQLVEADVHHLLEHGRPMPEQIIRDWPNIAPPVKYKSVLRPVVIQDPKAMAFNQALNQLEQLSANAQRRNVPQVSRGDENRKPEQADNWSKFTAAKTNEWGERPFGPKSFLPPKALVFKDDNDLALKLYQHFISGQGQPVVLNMQKLDFSKNLNAHKLFSKEALRAMLNLSSQKKAEESKALLERLTGKQIEKGFPVSNGKVSYLVFKDPFTPVQPDITPQGDFGKFAAFGRVTVDINHMEILIDNKQKIVTIQAELIQPGGDKKLDTFNFEDDPKRKWFWNGVTKQIHENAPPGSTSFYLYGKGVSYYKRIYSFQEFLNGT